MNDAGSFWEYVGKIKNANNNAMFEKLTHFIINLMRLPHSSAGAERTFSTLNLIKTKQRNRLLIPTCDGLMAAKTLLDGNKSYDWEPADELINPIKI